ncbi:MAG TPA: hypothetical protein VH107_19585 [Lacipirellulaceae bacterium]|jgi:hypothetical protein|nr:hypothetical protein [Lacipirellulaceae bacterium]
MKVDSRYPFGVLLVSLVVAAGCGEGPIKTVPVYGLVTFADREAPPTCDLVFQPLKVDGPKRPSFANRQADGHYQVKAFQNSRGLIPGTYHVQLVFHDLKPGADPKKDSGWNITNYDGGEINVDPSSGGVEYNIEVRKKS